MIKLIYPDQSIRICLPHVTPMLPTDNHNISQPSPIFGHLAQARARSPASWGSGPAARPHLGEISWNRQQKLKHTLIHVYSKKIMEVVILDRYIYIHIMYSLRIYICIYIYISWIYKLMIIKMMCIYI